MAGRHEDLVLLKDRRIAGLGDVEATGVPDVVAVRLQEPDHRVLGVHEPARAVVVRPGMPGPVVGHHGGALIRLGVAGRAVDRAAVQAVATLGVVGLPGLVGGLEQDVGVAWVVAHHERDQAFAAGVVANQVREIQAGHCVGRHRPRGRHGPVAAVDEAGRRAVVRARGLGLRECGGRLHVGDHLARPVPLVVAHAQDVDVVRARRSLDLEELGLAGCQAHLRGEALDRGVARAVYLPVAGRIPR